MQTIYIKNKEKKNITVGFIVLHYMNDYLTEHCVDSILNLSDIRNCKIIVVDNSSQNGSAERLKMKYCNNNIVEVLINSENKGFSGGNNEGYRYFKENYNPEFIIAVNNDVVFHEPDFIERLRMAYIESPFHVGGGDVYVPDRYLHQNPIMYVDSFLGLEEAIERKRNYEKKIGALSHNSVFAIKGYIKEKYRGSLTIEMLMRGKRVIDRILNINKNWKKNEYTQIWRKRSDNCVLFGACLIFDKRFISDNEVLFEPFSFMYEEELFLKLRCFIEDYRMLYLPDIQVWHLEEGSSSISDISFNQYKIGRANRYRQRKTAVEAYIGYLKYLEENGRI